MLMIQIVWELVAYPNWIPEEIQLIVGLALLFFEAFRRAYLNAHVHQSEIDKENLFPKEEDQNISE